ncbi:CsoS2 family carboxysome shell protein [Acidiferrobacter sp.]|jgi:hypothetical protein|uniref:CsoS2 family carboxysome shell protein n=1 Tax=Acidiferrobacter sp. TaxID=1872107 RepID=UPI0026231F96|nr:CsoS2 family carboxysome shell protein [Acidiferrobacter sp.]
MSDLSSAGRLHGRALAQEMRRRQAQQKLRGQGKAGVRAPQPKAARFMAPAQAAPEGQIQATQVMKADAREAQPVVDQAAQAAVGAASAATTVEDAVFDAVCEAAETKPETLGGQDHGVRTLCKARRRSLAQRGKVAIPVRNGLISAATRQNYRETGSVREFARRHRRELAAHGRGSAQPARPTGRRRRPDAPVKVETDQTLAGSTVTGTQVHRAASITGTEPGSCRTITGTEYLGVEHYTRFCDTRPEGGPTKVRVGRTTGNVGVSGTFLGQARTMTGDEAGTCRAVTGTEYVDAGQFQAACDASAPTRPAKVAMGRTARQQLPVSGSDEARMNRVTGAESGAAAKVTGSQYADGGAARMTINGAPKKVALTHTIAGREVSGTAVGNSGRITGLNAGECRTLTGTEYLSHETFTSVCRTEPQPSQPPKVEESFTQKRQRITGNLVDRSEKVTGNEPGSCLRLTGTGYNGPQPCGGGVDKVQAMTGLGGASVTGTGMDKLPKTTGDEHGGCWPVTGTAYYGREHYAQCASTPQAGARKVSLTHTDTGHIVSGPALGASTAVTGNEAGAKIAVSGTPYIGREEVMVGGSHAPVMAPGANKPSSEGCAGGCGCKQRFEELENRLRALQGELTDRSTVPRAASHRFVPAAPEPVSAAFETRPAGFSVAAPAQQGRSRLTGNAGDDSGRITGPINLARGLVTGTPEFRGREALPSAMAVAPAAVDGKGAPDAAPPAAGAWRITGDDWSRNDRVTGTEGRSARGRNPTQRGVARTCVMSAAGNRERPLAVPVPEGQVTGSSGNSPKGSVVTYSGGARG